MTLRHIVAALGGDLYAGGRRANVPAPGHSPDDRSVSLLLAEGRIVVHCFGGADWRVVMDDLRARGLVDVAGAPLSVGRTATATLYPPPSARVRIEAARALWDAAGPVGPGTLAAVHAVQRGIRRDLRPMAALRSHLAAPLSVYRRSSASRPALLAAVSNAHGELSAVEITYLDPNGARARGLRLPRKTIGLLPPGVAVRLDPAAPELLVAEGVFSALSAGARFGLPAWALLSTSNLRRWRPPPVVRRVLIAGDRGPDGERSVEILRAALGGSGVEAMVALPPVGAGDWNDVWLAEEEEEEGRGRAPGA